MESLYLLLVMGAWRLRDVTAGLSALCLLSLCGCGGGLADLSADGSLTAGRVDSLMALDGGVYAEGRVRVGAHVDSVWAILSDFTRWGDWNPRVKQTYTSEGDRLEWGLHFTQTLVWKPVPLSVEAVIVRIIPGREVVWKGSVLGLHILHEVSLSAAQDGGAEIRCRERMQGPLVLLLRAPILSECNRGTREALEGLQAMCEWKARIEDEKKVDSPGQAPGETKSLP